MSQPPTFDTLDKVLGIRERAARLDSYADRIKEAQATARTASDQVREAKDDLARAEADVRHLVLLEAKTAEAGDGAPRSNKEQRDAAVAKALNEDAEVRRCRETLRQRERDSDAAWDEVRRQENGFAGARAAADLISGSLRAIAR